MRIGFLLPSSEYLHDPFRGDPHTHFQILTVLESRFAAAVELLLVDLRGIKRQFALPHIPECDAYLHSVYTLDWNEQTAVVKSLRERYPKAKHIAGGPHAMVFPEESGKVFDSLILGDGEESIVSAVQDLMDGRLQAVYRQCETVDIKRYPFPRRHYLPASANSRPGLLALKDKPGLEQLLSTTVIFSRGCPYKCHFCHMPQTKELGLGIRFRTPRSIEDEIEYLKRDYGIQAISLLDEICLPLTPKKAVAHLEAIGRTGVAWKAQCRVDGIKADLARLTRQAGCVIMCMGVESVWQPCLDRINKRINIEQTKKSIRLLKEAGIEVRLYMIMGLPGEPPDIVERTWSFIQDTGPDLVYMSLLTVRPGTEMYMHPEAFGFQWINTDTDSTMHLINRYSTEAPKTTFEYRDGEGLSREQIVQNLLEIQRRLKENNLCTR